MTRRADRAKLAHVLAAAAASPQAALFVGARLTRADLIARASAAPLAGGAAPMPAGGLFDSDATAQGDLFD